MSNKTETAIEFVEGTLENALEEMKNRRTYLKKVMKPAEDAAKDLEKATVALNFANKKLDKALAKNIVHKNFVARHKAQLATAVNTLK